MDKKKMVFSAPQEEIVKFNNEEIVVKKYLSFEEQINLTTNYCIAYFFPSKDVTIKGVSDWNYYGAEYTLRLNILNACTNIEVYDNDNKVIDGVNNIFYTPLWDMIVGRIVNYTNFRFSLNKIVDDIEKQISYKNSVGFNLNELMAKLASSIKELSNLDLSPENLERLKETAKSVDNVLKTSTIGKIYEEAEKK